MYVAQHCFDVAHFSNGPLLSNIKITNSNPATVPPLVKVIIWKILFLVGEDRLLSL